MKHLSLFFVALLLFAGNILAQEDTAKYVNRKIADEKSDFVKEKLEKKNKSKKSTKDNLVPLEELNVTIPDSVIPKLNFIRQMYEFNKMKKKPEVYKSPESTEKKNNEGVINNKSESLPSNIRMVAEFEEMQAVLVSIPSYPFAKYAQYEVQIMTNHETFNWYRENYAIYLGLPTPTEVHFAPGKGVYWPILDGLSNDFNEYHIYDTDEITWIPDLGMFSLQGGGIDHTVGDIWGKLIYEIQQECDVWIRLTGKDDYEDYIFQYFTQRGFNIDKNKCKLFSNGTEDAFWVRDWGPFGVYYNAENNQRKLGFMDPKYYRGRQFDDVFSRTVLDEQDYEYWDFDVKMEGGNIMNDGISFGTYGDVIYEANAQREGQYYWNENTQKWNLESRSPLTKPQLDARMKEYLGFDDVIVVESLDYDGGTGHIDLWIKQFDPETFLIANYPENPYNQLADYAKIQRNREKLNELNTVYGNKYRFLNAPMPTLDNNDPMPHTNDAYDADPRGYLNGLIVNNAYIYPSFSKPGDANWVTDSTNNEILKDLLPGYRLVPIDSRYLTPMGGAIHCITMQIPKDSTQMVKIIHEPLRGNVENTENFELSAELISELEVNKMNIYWKKTSDSEWTTIEMTTNDDITFDASISGKFSKEDTIQYYIAAQKDAQILNCAPKTAPKGYYSFYFDETNTIIDILYGYVPTSSAIASIYPNPATDHINVIFENENNGNVSIEIINSLGQTISNPINRNFARGVFTVDINELSLPQGTYFLKMTIGANTSTKSFIIK